MDRRNALIASLGWSFYAYGAEEPTSTIKLLFVGNSLTYYGNLPAVFDALSLASGKPCESQMLVKGGSILHDRVADNSVARALKARRYDYVVLQERGGDVAGYMGAAAETKARDAARNLARIIKNQGSQSIYLGTYQGNPTASAQIVSAESELARSLSIPYVSVSDRLVFGLRTHPELQWFHDDGMHPGAELTLLQAVRLFSTIFGLHPASQPLSVSAPIYGPGASFYPPALASQRARIEKPVARERTYSTEVIEEILAIAEAPK